MYRVLSDKELKVFAKKYFKIWNKDIVKVSVINYNGINEYLINDAILFLSNN